MTPSCRRAKAETRDHVLLPSVHGFAYVCVWLRLQPSKPPAQHYPVQRQLGAAGSRLDEKWQFSTASPSQPKTALDCESSCSAPLVMRAKLFADNNIPQEGGISRLCFPAGLGTAVWLFIFSSWWYKEIENSDRLSSGDCSHLSPSRQKTPPISPLWLGHGSRQGEGRAGSASHGLSKEIASNAVSSQKCSNGGTLVKFRFLMD